MRVAAKPVVLVTGVSGGIGLAVAKIFAAKNWIVVGTVRGKGRSGGVRGIQADIQVADMLRAPDIERVVKSTRRTYGRLDAIVACAGYGMLGPAEAFNYAQTDELMAVNVVAPAELVRQALPIMLAQGRGVIVGLSSISGRTGMPGYSLYTASKFGLEGLFEALSLELENTPVRVKLVEPSSVHTAFWQVLKRSSGRAKKDRLFAMPAAKDKLDPEVVAAAVYRAVTDGKRQLRYPVGLTIWVNAGRRLLPERLYLRLVNWLAAR